ncbi:MAG: type II toxin-antitoxin system VapC family toxin [Candidatus Wukongarchaeota archaeon]|nr:type II toxin-antitoxin system VapC family toxin [Candidatus Wukongarchaeota archaeon]
MQKFLLDTNVFNEKNLLYFFKKEVEKKRLSLYINPVIFLELGFIHHVRGTWGLFEKLIKEFDIEVLEIDEEDAKLAIFAAYKYKDTPEGASAHFRDCLIGATAEKNFAILITKNARDFQHLPQELIKEPSQIMKTQKKSLHNG